MVFGHSPQQLLPPPGQLLPKKFPPDSPPRKINLSNSPGQLPSRQSPLMKSPQGQLPIPWIFPPQNYPWIIPPWTVTPMKLPIGQLPPGLLLLEHFSLNNSSLNNYPQTTDPQWNSFQKWQWTFALKNYPLIIYRCCSKKVLFTHSSLEILNKF